MVKKIRKEIPAEEVLEVNPVIEPEPETEVEMPTESLTVFERERIASRQREHERNVREYLAGGK